MKLSDLTAYAEGTFHIKEIHKWPDFPGFSVLSDMETGKWVALLIREHDYERGRMIECCDLKCSNDILSESSKPYLRPPFRMKGSTWIGICFDDTTEEDVVLPLFDKAVRTLRQQASTIIIDTADTEGNYHDTPIPSHGNEEEEDAPERIREMKKLYSYSSQSLFDDKCRNFYIQGKAMEDYEDNAPLPGPFKHYYTTYHDLNTSALRGYFSWRTELRKGHYQPISPSFAYLYIYELINGIGVKSPEEGFGRIREFEKNFVLTGYGNKGMLNNIHRWLFDYIILNNLPEKTAMEYATADEVLYAKAIAPLLTPESSDDEIFQALCTFCYKSFLSSPVARSKEGAHLTAASWRHAVLTDPSFIIRIFRSRMRYPWFPMENAVYYLDRSLPDTSYQLLSITYSRENGWWRITRYSPSALNRKLFSAFIHETDKELRKYLKTGRPIKDKPGDEWAEKYIKSVIENDRKEKQEKSKPEIRIDMANLEKIRADALIIRDNLLTEDELDNDSADVSDNDDKTESSYDKILQMLLDGNSPDIYIKEHHLLPSVVVDSINEAYFDEIGDSIVQSDGNTLILIEDYINDIREVLGGKNG